MSDEVNAPDHYNQGDVECIDAIKASMSVEGFEGYLKGNIMKYVWRYRHKGKATQDLAKAGFYFLRLQELVGQETTSPIIDGKISAVQIYQRPEGHGTYCQCHLCMDRFYK